jgi:uncharacterized protein
MASPARKPPARGQFDVAGKPAAWQRDGQLDGRPLVILAHGAGAPDSSPFMEAVAAGLVTRGAAAVRFRFPYMERRLREDRRFPPDRTPVLLATFAALLAAMRNWKLPVSTPLVLAGKSMGGRMASLFLAHETPMDVRAAIYFGYPLTPARGATADRAAHLPRVRVPQLFLSGSRDTLCDLSKLQMVLAPLGKRARLHVVDGGDHSLAVSRREPLRGSEAWLEVAAQFVREVCDSD